MILERSTAFRTIETGRAFRRVRPYAAEKFDIFLERSPD
jgi:hypothetical protein